jgi:hypothetical protein
MAESPLEILEGMSSGARLLLRRGRLTRTEEIDRRVLKAMTEMQAVATALVMLDLLGEDEAERVLVGHRHDVEAASGGVEARELTLRSSVAHGFQQARRRPLNSLVYRPVAVAAPDVSVHIDGFDVLVEWLAVSAAGVRGRAVISAGDGRPLSSSQLRLSVPAVSDKGGQFELRVHAGRPGVTVTPPPWASSGSVTAHVGTDPLPNTGLQWMELGQAKQSPIRIEFRPPSHGESGVSQPEWATPAEWVLDAILPDVARTRPDATFGVGLGPQDALGVASAVADALLAVGALPPTSSLLTSYPARQVTWDNEVTHRYTARANQAFDTGRARKVAAVGVDIPLRHGVAVLDAVVVQEGDVWLHVYMSPDATGEYWPVAFRPVHLYATDDLGHKHYAIPASYWAVPDHEGYGDRWMWPPLDPKVSSLRFTVSTPWEAAWSEVDLRER